MPPIPGARRPVAGASGPVPLALVLHANQHLITDGYDTREGISEVAAALVAVAALHLEHQVPVHLNVSGTLMEALAWHSPDALDWLRALHQAGLVEVLGSAYAQSILTAFGVEHNRRQLSECLALCQRHLGVRPEEVAGLWVPERVWDTATMAPLVTWPGLPNGGYRWVLIDDRLAYPLGAGYEGSPRQRFDASTAPARGEARARPPGTRLPSYAHLRPWLVEGLDSVVAVPLSGDLRYCVPPRRPEHWAALDTVLVEAGQAGPGAVAVFGDDFERVAALGPWGEGPWTRAALAPYEAFLAGLTTTAGVAPVLITPWLADQETTPTRRVEPGTFYELAHVMGAGEDCAGWWSGAEWQPSRRLLAEVEAVLEHPPPSARPALWELAWKQLMACAYETGWHVVEDGEPRLAPWSVAVAAHARSALVIAAAACWAPSQRGEVFVEVADIDGDGDEEVVVATDHLYAVISPRHGGRLVALFELDGAGRSLVGNPADDWNWQQELHRFMDVPRNHPGAFADVGHEHDRYRVVAVERAVPAGVEVILANHEQGSPLRGARKRYVIAADARHLEVGYHIPRAALPLVVDVALSPDYLGLLRGGCRAWEPVELGRAYGVRTGAASAWVVLPEGEPVGWADDQPEACGHGVVARVAASAADFRVVLSVESQVVTEDQRPPTVVGLGHLDDLALRDGQIIGLVGPEREGDPGSTLEAAP